MRTKAIQTTAGPILFRFPLETEVWAYNKALPILREASEAAGEPGTIMGAGALIDALAEALPACDAMLIACAKAPLLVDYKFVSDAERIDINDLSGTERLKIGTELMRLAGASAEEAARLSPLDVTAPVS